MRYQVYVIASDSMVKVGFTGDVERRLKTLQIGNPLPLSVQYLSEPTTKSAAYRIEQHAHSTLWPYAIHGEWFRCPVGVAVGAIQNQTLAYIQTQTPAPSHVSRLKHEPYVVQQTLEAIARRGAMLAML